MTDSRIHNAICHLNGLLNNGGATVHGPWLADTIAFLRNIPGILDAQNNVVDGLKCEVQRARDDALEVAAQVSASRYPAPPAGIHGHRASVHRAGLDIADAIRSLKGGK